MDIFPLSDERRSELQSVYRTTTDANQRTRCHIILLWDEGYSTEALISIFQVCEDTIYRAIARYRNGGVAALVNQPHLGPKKGYTPEDENLLVETVKQSPRSLELPFSNWSLPTLADYMTSKTGRHMGRHAVADVLHAHKINMRRPKLKVTSPDPDYTERRGQSSSSLVTPHSRR
jgi:transposase